MLHRMTRRITQPLRGRLPLVRCLWRARQSKSAFCMHCVLTSLETPHANPIAACISHTSTNAPAPTSPSRLTCHHQLPSFSFFSPRLRNLPPTNKPSVLCCKTAVFALLTTNTASSPTHSAQATIPGGTPVVLPPCVANELNSHHATLSLQNPPASPPPLSPRIVYLPISHPTTYRIPQGIIHRATVSHITPRGEHP